MPTLTIQLPGFPPVEHLLPDEMMTLGRMKGNTITLDDASVSVSHAKITRKGAEFFLKDLNSTNGTMLNGQSINEARIKDGDQINFGEVIAIFRCEPASVPAPVPRSIGTTTSPVVPAPTPVSIGTTLVSKRPTPQTAQSSQNLPPTSSSAHTPQTSRFQKKQKNWLVPVVVLLAAVIVVVTFSGGDDPKPSSNSAPPAGAVSSNTKPPAKPGSAARAAGAESSEGKLANSKKSLKAVDPADRRRAAAALHALGAGAKEALPELRNALKDSDADVRMWAALALINNKSYDKAAIPILVQVLHTENSMLRQVSCLSLALIPYEATEKEIVVAALAESANQDEDAEVRKTAISALKIIAPEVIAGGR